MADEQYDKDDTDGLRIGGHQWVKANDLVRWPHCAVCGSIRRHDDKNRPCKGAAKIALRNYYTEGAAVPESQPLSGATPRTDALFPIGPLGVPETRKTITEIAEESRQLERARAALIEALKLVMMVLSCAASKEYIQYGLDVGEETLAAVKERK